MKNSTESKQKAKQPTPGGGTSSLASLVTSFLKKQGFEVYRIQSMQEAYEIKNDNEVLRIYVTGRKGSNKHRLE